MPRRSGTFYSYVSSAQPACSHFDSLLSVIFSISIFVATPGIQFRLPSVLCLMWRPEQDAMHHYRDTRPSGNVTWCVLMADMVKETITEMKHKRKADKSSHSVCLSEWCLNNNKKNIAIWWKEFAYFFTALRNELRWLKACITAALRTHWWEHKCGIFFFFSYSFLTPSLMHKHTHYLLFFLYLPFPPSRFFLPFQLLYSYYTAEGRKREN